MTARQEYPPGQDRPGETTSYDYMCEEIDQLRLRNRKLIQELELIRKTFQGEILKALLNKPGGSKMIYVKHDPILRGSYRREVAAVKGKCDWCGERKRVYSYTWESDSRRGRITDHSFRQFCNLNCFNSHYLERTRL